MSIGVDVYREIESIIDKKGKEEDGKKISSDLLPAARDMNNTLKDFENDLSRFKNKMHESGLDAEFGGIKSELRSKISNFLSN
jgi:hypothetical protein